MKLLRNIIAEKLFKPQKSTTIVTQDEKGIYAIINGLLDISDDIRDVWQPFLQSLIEYNVSVGGITREQLLKLVIEQPEQLLPLPKSGSQEKKKLEII